MSTFAPTTENVFYILSNFAVGSTDKGDYWREHISTLQRDSISWHTYHLEPVPTITLDTDSSSPVTALLNSSHTRIELWPTWCSFLTPDRRIGDSFLLINVGYHSDATDATVTTPTTVATEASPGNGWQRLQLTLHFTHQQHLNLLEAIDRAEQLHLCVAGDDKGLLVPLYDPELSLHLEYIRPLHR